MTDIKQMIENRLAQLMVEINRAEPMAHEANFARFWEGKLVALKSEAEFLQSLLDTFQ